MELWKVLMGKWEKEIEAGLVPDEDNDPFNPDDDLDDEENDPFDPTDESPIDLYGP